MPNTREKLIELLANDDCPMFMVFGDSMDGLVDYLIANGVTVLPCKVGDTVYFTHIIGTREDTSPIEQVREGMITDIRIERNNRVWIDVDFGIWHCCRPYTDFCFTKAEAEAKLYPQPKGE